MKTLTKICVALVSPLAILAVVRVGVEVVQFHAIVEGVYTTPWHDNRFWIEPYTALRVKMAGPVELWTQNGEGSQNWLVREAVIGGKTFWTVLEKRPTPPGSRMGVAHKGL